jgi:hypothetical protein
MPSVRRSGLSAMEIRNPTWRLADRCPACEQGTLVLRVCPDCSLLLVICEDEGAVFRNPRNLQEVFDYPRGDLCPSCGKVSLDRFADATDIQIQNWGLRAGEYV